MNELIKIEQRDGIKTVNARELHSFLEVGKDFSTWIKDRIDQFGFVENQDYIVFPEMGEKGGRPSIEYYLTLDMAKEMSMVERNEKGKQARLYFIECEKIAQQAPALALPQNYKEALEHLLVQVNINEAQAKQIEQDRPKVEFAEAVSESKHGVDMALFAKSFEFNGEKMGRNKIYKFLRNHRYLMSGVNTWNIPFQRYIDQGWFIVKEGQYENDHSNGPRVFFKTLITGRGQIAISRMLTEHFADKAA